MLVSTISPQEKISLDDYSDLQKEFSKSAEKWDYTNSWGYIIQSTFFGGFMQKESGSKVLVTTRYPNKPPFVVVKHFGGLEGVVETANELVRQTNEKVVVKNVGKEELSFLEENGFCAYREGDCWSQLYKFDDDTYPRPVVELEALCSLEGKTLKTLRYFMTRFRKNHSVKILPYSPLLFKEAVLVHGLWSDDFKRRFSETAFKDPLVLHSVGLHRAYIDSIYSSCDEKKVFSYVLYADGRPVGFSLAEKISKEAVALYCNISSNEFVGLNETLVFETLKRAFEKGFEYGNLGGSEFMSLHNFKRKFAPFAFEEKTHAVLYPDALL